MGTLLRTARPGMSLLASGARHHGLRGLLTSGARARGPLWDADKHTPPSCWSCAAGARRHLLTDDVLRLREFQQRKIAAAYLIYGKRDSYMALMEEKLANHQLILTEDLKTAVHLCQTPVDAQLIIKLIYRYHAENSNLLLGDFKFGPLVCRLFYELGMAKEAVQLLMDRQLKEFFGDHTSFAVVIDMLYEKQDYESALNVIKEMRQRGTQYTKDTYLLALALCYKLNTHESYEVCQSVLDDAEINMRPVARRGYCFAVMLAINQGDLKNARALYNRILKPNSKVCLNLQERHQFLNGVIVATLNRDHSQSPVGVLLAALTGSRAEMLHLLKSVRDGNISNFVHKIEICRDVMSQVQSSLEGETHDPEGEDLQNLLGHLEQMGHITAMPFDTLLCSKPRSQRNLGGQASRLKGSRGVDRRTGALSQTLLTE